jgi:ATP-dependent RNA helicase RhlE
LVDGIIKAGYDKEPRAIQDLSIPKIKSGTDLYMIAPEGAGKTTAIAIAIVQQLKKPVEVAPRAIIMVETKDKAFALEEEIKRLSKYTGLRTFVVFDAGIIQYQKDMIYEGLDIVIGTPQRLNELISTTGIPLTKVRHFIVDDLDSYPLNKYPQIYRIADNVEKAQFIMASNTWKDNFERVTDRIMKGGMRIEA